MAGTVMCRCVWRHPRFCKVAGLASPRRVRQTEQNESGARRGTAIRLGYQLVVVTNQSGIARGLYTESDFQNLMDFIRAEFAARQTPLAAVYHCPYHPQHGIGDYKREHEDRKPGPGMILRAARDLNIDLSKSVMVGDRCSDVAAANAAQLPQAFLLAGTESATCPGDHLLIHSLGEVEAWLSAKKA